MFRGYPLCAQRNHTTLYLCSRAGIEFDSGNRALVSVGSSPSFQGKGFSVVGKLLVLSAA